MLKNLINKNQKNSLYFENNSNPESLVKNNTQSKNKKNTEDSYIKINNVYAAYKNNSPVLKNIDLNIPSGQITSIIGPNGAGKSTLFYLLIGLKKPLKGEIQIFGKSSNFQRNKNNIAYVPQEEEIDWDYPIRVCNVVLGGRYGHIKSTSGWQKFIPPCWAGNNHKKAVKKALKAVEMYSYRRSPLGELSGGQKKRVFIARALAQQAQLLLLDEPFIGIDPYSEKLIMNILKNSKKQGKTIIMITHDLSKVKEIADFTVLLNQKIVTTGSPEDILKYDNINTLFKNLSFSENY